MHRRLPYPDADGLVQITPGREQGSLTGGFSLAEFRDWQDESRSYTGLALFSSDQFSVVLPGAPARPLQGAVVSDGFFELLGSPMRFGRGLAAADAGANRSLLDRVLSKLAVLPSVHLSSLSDRGSEDWRFPGGHGKVNGRCTR